jgi:predicted phage baseplate assembly protein
MTTKPCGCTKESCGCCEGIRLLTPQPAANRPGLSALSYRVGTHGAFVETMKARLSTMTVEVMDADQKPLTFRPLVDLTTRDTSDFSIALLDAWATVADVLTFYEQRIANEAYLRTATERRSILELARLLGYTLRPGVAATVYLAYTIDEDNSVTPPKPVKTTIPKGSRVQSIPGSGELPQSFETSHDLEARSEWNNLQVRMTRPQNITLANVLAIDKLFVAGTDTKLKPGDSLLFVFDDTGKLSALRTVASTEGQYDQNQTQINLQPIAPFIRSALDALLAFRSAIKVLPAAASEHGAKILSLAEEYVHQTYLGAARPEDWSVEFTRHGVSQNGAFAAAFSPFNEKLHELQSKPLRPEPAEVITTDPSLFASQLLKPAPPQLSSRWQLSQNLSAAFQPARESNPQLLIRFAPELRNTFYTAWSNANVNVTPRTLKGVFALRIEASLFGASAPKMPTYGNGNKPNPPNTWAEWPLDGERNDAVFLDQAYGEIRPDSYAVIFHDSGRRQVKHITGARTLQHTAYGISGKTTQLVFDRTWKKEGGDLGQLRAIIIRVQSEALTVVNEPITADVQGQEIPFDKLYDSLTARRWVIVCGERTDIPAVTGVNACELLMISGLRQEFDSTIPGDKTRTIALLATPMTYSYKRDTVTICGNVVKATHGETRKETLGGGDGSQSLQSFALKQPPLTFVSAPNPSGVKSTLEVLVNDLQWHETDTLAGLDSRDRKFITKTDDNGTTTVVFGNGKQGARLPTGQANVKAVYRSGIGRAGNVKAEQISLLQTRPLGAKAVINPLPASGGADKESRDQARENAPLAVMSLDRLVSVQDYVDFARTFAGIGKAAARKLSDSQRQLVHVTIAGIDDIPIEKSSDLYQNLVAALRRFGDPDLPVQLDLRELVVLILSAKLRLAPDYQWEPVVTNIRVALLDGFGFEKRALGQPALLSELISLIQNIPGVEYVDVDAFDGVPQQLSLKGISDAVQGIAQRPPAPRVDVSLATFDQQGTLHPAQLAIFTEAVPDTIVLNQIK